jgi:hypothetical protein
MLRRHHPHRHVLIRRFSSRQIRNCATIGSNMRMPRQSPASPALLALDGLMRALQRVYPRSISVVRFFTNDHLTSMTPGAFVERIDVRVAQPATIERNIDTLAAGTFVLVMTHAQESGFVVMLVQRSYWRRPDWSGHKAGSREFQPSSARNCRSCGRATHLPDRCPVHRH